MAEVSIRRADWQHDRALIEHVRRCVFIVEQGVPESEEWDAADRVCEHALAFTTKRDVIGTGRLEGTGKIGRIAVLPAWRGRGVGDLLLAHLIGRARQEGFAGVHLNAQTHALAFYERHGFRAVGAVFDEVGIPHRRMQLEFDDRPR